jgi:hypothetical protein
MATIEEMGTGGRARQPLETVVLDLDGVLIEGEEVWDTVREGLVRERGGHWVPEGHCCIWRSPPSLSSTRAPNATFDTPD